VETVLTRDAIRLVTVRDTSTPLVHVRLLFEAGSADDPKGKEGLAALTASLIARGGSTERTRREILSDLHPIAAELSVSTGKDTLSIFGTVHRDNLDAFAEIFTELVLSPGFGKHDVKREKAAAQLDIKSAAGVGGGAALARLGLCTSVYAGSPRAHAAFGSRRGIRAITANDLARFHTQYFTRSKLVLGVAGAYPKSFPQELARRLAALPEGEPSAARQRAAKAKPQQTRTRSDRIGSRFGSRFVPTFITAQTPAPAVALGIPLVNVASDIDAYRLAVVQAHLGAHRALDGSLMRHLHEENGLVDAAYSYLDPASTHSAAAHRNDPFGNANGNPFADLPVRPRLFEVLLRPVSRDTTTQAIQQTLRQLEALVSEGLSDDEFETARKKLINSRTLTLASPWRRLSYAMDQSAGGVDWIFANSPADSLSTMTAAEVNQAIRAHISPALIHIAVVSAQPEEAIRGFFEQALEASKGKSGPVSHISVSRDD